MFHHLHQMMMEYSKKKKLINRNETKENILFTVRAGDGR